MQHFDVFIIGAGMAGITVANKCAVSGLSVGITDEIPYGGTCALRGCDPKKVLISATEAINMTENLQGKGITGKPEINWSDLMRFKNTFTEPMPAKVENGFRKNGVKTFHEKAEFIGKNKLQLGNEQIEAEKILIATGAQPRPMGIPGANYALTSTDFLNLDVMPDSILFIGGGYIAFEFAHIAARAGAEVTIIHRGTHPLENFDSDIVKHLQSATEKLGVKIHLETEALEIHKEKNMLIVKGRQEEKEVHFQAEAVLNSSGRVPAIADLALDKAGVSHGNNGVEVNRHLQSVSNPHVYAAGDTADTDGLPLTPVAVMEGHVVASNIINGNKKSVNYGAIPSVVFTLPSIAAVGLTEQTAKAKNIDVSVNYQEASSWFNAKRLNENQYAFKTITDKNSGQLLGAHLIGPEAAETINLFAMAITTRMKAKDLKKMIYAYPTFGSDLSYML